jgi:hypothetical protein
MMATAAKHVLQALRFTILMRRRYPTAVQIPIEFALHCVFLLLRNPPLTELGPLPKVSLDWEDFLALSAPQTVRNREATSSTDSR